MALKRRSDNLVFKIQYTSDISEFSGFFRSGRNLMLRISSACVKINKTFFEQVISIGGISPLQFCYLRKESETPNFNQAKSLNQRPLLLPTGFVNQSQSSTYISIGKLESSLNKISILYRYRKHIFNILFLEISKKLFSIFPIESQ